MLKRFATIVLAGFYLVVTAGFTVNAHYCSGKLVDYKIFKTPSHCCSKEKSCHSDSINCCDDETIMIQLDQWQIATTLPGYQAHPNLLAPGIPIFRESYALNTEPLKKYSRDHPPPQRESLWLLYRKITFYG